MKQALTKPLIAAALATAAHAAPIGQISNGDDQVSVRGKLNAAITSVNTLNLSQYIFAADPQYGVVGDGVADDTAALQSVFNAANGRAVVLGDGTYKVSLLYISADLVMSSGAVIKRASAGGQYVRVNQDGVTITGGVFDGDRATHGEDAGVGVVAHNARRVTFRDVLFVNHGYYAAGATSDADYLAFDACVISNSLAGISVWTGDYYGATHQLTGVSVTGCRVDLATEDDTNDGVRGIYIAGGTNALARVEEATIKDNIVSLPPPGPAFQLPIELFSHAERCTVSGNRVDGGKYAISIGGNRGQNRHNAIVGNICQGGIEVISDDTTVSGNVMHDTTYGVIPFEASRVAITGNTFNNVTYAIRLNHSHGEDAYDLAITGNTFAECNAGVYAYKIAGTHANVNYAITGNIFTSTNATPTAQAIVIHGMSGINITGNTFKGQDRCVFLSDGAYGAPTKINFSQNLANGCADLFYENCVDAELDDVSMWNNIDTANPSLFLNYMDYSANIRFTYTTGVPSVQAGAGSIWVNLNGGAGATLYIKENSSDSVWNAID